MDNPKHPPGPGPTCPEEQMAEDIERLENKCVELARREWEARQDEDIQRVARYRSEAGESEAYRVRDTALAALRECRDALQHGIDLMPLDGTKKRAAYIPWAKDALATANRALGEGEEG